MWVSSNGRKKQTKLEEEAISEILVADTACESGAKTILRKKKNRNNSSSKPQQK